MLQRVGAAASVCGLPLLLVATALSAARMARQSARTQAYEDRGRAAWRRLKRSTGSWTEGENPTNIASVNLVMGCSKGSFSAILSSVLAY